ncbi:sugar phosphate isomerase/epimerase [Acidisoma cellulosilytica]|uniref:Sugar phosphate isomerase/epimerase n=1 Tax=Acidisoma cellulosilyticum TaxID=2802395 RepID=A0A963YZ77_9PROT|nr:sugar phosphate isomerase/epimerase family protein [Acidisoma cellulosilyticum]MCB8879799.1 sugar phosphate isomerase/epimerase [Acidisoma cellulosilyticum]
MSIDSSASSRLAPPLNALFINTILLGGSVDAKIAAAGAAGFDAIEVWRQDVDAAGGVAPVRAALAERALGLIDYQVLLDFDGAADDKRAAKRAEALAMLETGRALGAHTLLAPASTDSACDPSRIVEDIGWLADRAAEMGMRIAYEPMAWSKYIHTLPSAVEILDAANRPNLLFVIDAFHIFARERTVVDLSGIAADRIALVQLSDYGKPIAPGAYRQVARHSRLLPGEGAFPIGALLRKLADIGYAGPIGLEVFNDELKSLDPAKVAARAMLALRRSVDTSFTSEGAKP